MTSSSLPLDIISHGDFFWLFCFSLSPPPPPPQSRLTMFMKAPSLQGVGIRHQRYLCSHCHLMASLSIKGLHCELLSSNCTRSIGKIAKCDYIKLWATSRAKLSGSFQLLEKVMLTVSFMLFTFGKYIPCHSPLFGVSFKKIVLLSMVQ